MSILNLKSSLKIGSLVDFLTVVSHCNSLLSRAKTDFTNVPNNLKLNVPNQKKIKFIKSKL